MSEIEKADVKISIGILKALINKVDWVEQKSALTIAIQALQEKQEREKPKKLTCDELLQRTTPVWVDSKFNGGGYWCLCDKGMIVAPSRFAFNAEFYASLGVL